MLTDILYYKIKDETHRELLEIILRNAKRLKQLSDNLLDITKIETRSLNLNKKFFNLNILISEVLKDYVNKQKNQLKVEIVYYFKHKADIFLEADRDRISQVIRNLLDNALKFTMHSNQTVFVIVDKKEGQKQVIVSVKILEKAYLTKYYLSYLQSLQLVILLLGLAWDYIYVRIL
jgi:signal transduction histidine kinase